MATRVQLNFSRARFVASAALVVAAVATIGCDGPRRAAFGPNIVLIVVDALRSDRLGAYGYHRPVSPNIDALARGGTTFERAVTQAGWTKPSIASLFTSTYPHVHSAIHPTSKLPGEVLTLAEKLETLRYFNIGVQTNPFLASERGFAQGFKFYEQVNGAEGHTLVNELMGRLKRAKPEKFFAYLHFFDVHLPYKAPERHQKKFLSPYSGILDRVEVNSRRRLYQVLPELGDADRRHISQRYDADVSHVDEMVGRLMGRLKELDYLDNTLFIITADHGEELFDRGGFEHGHGLYQELALVPLIFHHPRLVPGGVRVKQLVRLIDVFPTVMGLLGVANPSTVMGVDLVPAMEDPDEDWNLPGFTAGVLYGPQQIAVQRGAFKMIQRLPARESHEIGYLKEARQTDLKAGGVDFYDLSRDPGEKEPFTAPTLERRFARLLEQLSREDPGVRYGAEDEPLDAEHLEQLKSLGYFGGQ